MKEQIYTIPINEALEREGFRKMGEKWGRARFCTFYQMSS